MSPDMCHVLRYTCHVSHVPIFFGQTGEGYCWRVYYQRGLPRLVYVPDTWHLTHDTKEGHLQHIYVDQAVSGRALAVRPDKFFQAYHRKDKKNKGQHGTDPWSTPIVFRYLSYSTELAEHAVHHLRRCLAFGQSWTCLFMSLQLNGYWRPERLATWLWPD